MSALIGERVRVDQPSATGAAPRSKRPYLARRCQPEATYGGEARASLPLLAAVACKLEAPVDGAEEGEQYGAVGHLEVEGVVEHGDGDAGIDHGGQVCERRGVSEVHVLGARGTCPW